MHQKHIILRGNYFRRVSGNRYICILIYADLLETKILAHIRSIKECKIKKHKKEK